MANVNKITDHMLHQRDMNQQRFGGSTSTLIVVLRVPDSWSNWNLEMLVFEEKGKPEKNLSKQRREPTKNRPCYPKFSQGCIRTWPPGYCQRKTEEK